MIDANVDSVEDGNELVVISDVSDCGDFSASYTWTSCYSYIIIDPTTKQM